MLLEYIIQPVNFEEIAALRQQAGIESWQQVRFARLAAASVGEGCSEIHPPVNFNQQRRQINVRQPFNDLLFQHHTAGGAFFRCQRGHNQLAIFNLDLTVTGQLLSELRRHGLRVSELVDLRLKDLDLEIGRLYVRRKKGSLSTHQPIEGDELRALRTWLREREQRCDARSPYLFLSECRPMIRQTVNYLVAEIGKRAKLRFHVHPHMLWHSTGYYLANRGYDTRLVQII